MKNKIVIVTFIVLIFITFVITVLASEDPDIDIVGGSGPSGQTGSGETFKYNDFAGIRISLVKSDGTDVATKNYLEDDIYIANANKIVKTTSSNCSRPAYANGKCSILWNGGVSLGTATEKLSKLQSLFTVSIGVGDDKETYSFPVELSHVVNPKSRSYAGIFDGIKFENTDISKEDYQKYIYVLINNILSDFDAGKIEDYLVKGEKNKLYDLFVVIEPLELVKMNNTDFVGTSYELANEAYYHQKNGGFVNSKEERPCLTSPNGALCDLGASLRKSSPCKTYLDGNIINSMKEKESTVLIKNFPDGYYFKNVKVDYENTKKKCTSSDDSARIDINAAVGNYGVGMGVVWVSNLYDGNNISCDSIKEAIGWSKENELLFEQAYNEGGTQAIYDLYPNGNISYIDGSNESIDIKWFVNRCTCYGMYEHYASNNLINYQETEKDKVDNISNIFGSSDWFTVPQLYETKGWLIEDKLESINFASFNDKWIKYSEDNNLEWTPITGDEYVNSLKCGTKENYWCVEFETWYEEMRTTYSGLSSYPSINTIKNSSLAIINERYKEQLQTMIDAYNVNFYPANGMTWTLGLIESDNTFSYIKQCINAQVASCPTIIDFYKKNEGIDLNLLACDKLREFNFDSYNKSNNTNITGEWFVSVCGCNQALSFNCTPNYDIGSCTNGDETLYTDSSLGIINDEYWENCVFNDYGKYDIDSHKVSDKNDNLTYYEKDLGSQYCEVYCIEDLTANLASPDILVEAGSKFEWGYSNISGSRTCKTKFVEWDKFEQDLKDANQAIADAYVDWQVEIKMNEITWEKSSEKNCAWSCDDYDTIDCSTEKSPNCSTTVCVRGSYKDYTYTPSSTHETYSVTGDFSSSDSDSTSSVCGFSSIPKWNPEEKKKIYEQAKIYAQSLVDDMKACYTWNQEDIYEVNPQAVIIYSDDINYYYNDELEKSTSYSFIDESICDADIAKQIKDCIGNKCSTTDVDMKNCSGDSRYVMMKRSSSTNFYLKGEVFRYVLKSNHLSFHSSQLGNFSNFNFTTNYIDVGYPNFPVSFSAPSGVYGTYEDKGQLDVEYGNLGHVEIGKTMIDTILEDNDNILETGKEYGKWICEYSVYSDLLSENDPGRPNGGIGDINVIYRTIDLEKPFPDIDSSGRNVGNNWCDLEGDCTNNNNFVKDYIYNNRNVSSDEIYDLEPMYTFVLTPSIIKEIRKYNDENSYTSYTGNLGNTKYFDYKCDEGTGNACISEYLSYLIEITGAKNKPGVCVEDKFRNQNDPKGFYNCKF